MTRTQPTNAKETTMTKKQLLTKLSRTMANNWIATGDKPESSRTASELTIRRIYKTSTIAQLKSAIDNISVA